jgi:hypothetical protein
LECCLKDIVEVEHNKIMRTLRHMGWGVYDPLEKYDTKCCTPEIPFSISKDIAKPDSNGSWPDGPKTVCSEKSTPHK